MLSINLPLTYPFISLRFLFSQSQRTPAEETDKRAEPGNPAEFLYPGPSHLYSGPTPGGYSANSTPSGFTPGTVLNSYKYLTKSTFLSSLHMHIVFIGGFLF